MKMILTTEGITVTNASKTAVGVVFPLVSLLLAGSALYDWIRAGVPFSESWFTLTETTALAEAAFAAFAGMSTRGRVLRYLDMLEARTPGRTEAQRAHTRRLLTAVMDDDGAVNRRLSFVETFRNLSSTVVDVLAYGAAFVAREKCR